MRNQNANTRISRRAIGSTDSEATQPAVRGTDVGTNTALARSAGCTVSRQALPIGSEWILADPDPFSKTIIKAKVLAVENNWVQYTINSGFDKWTKDVDSFLNAYLPCS